MPRALPRRGGPTRRPLDHALGTPAKVAVLRLLTAGGEPMSQRECARRCGIQLRSAQRALADLAAIGMVEVQRDGRDHRVALAARHYLAEPLARLFLSEAEVFLAQRQAVAAAFGPDPAAEGVRYIGLFGSAARGDDKPDSDADMLLITADEKTRTRALDRLLAAAPDLRRTFGRDVRPVAYTLATARRMWRRQAEPLTSLARDAIPGVVALLDQ